MKAVVDTNVVAYYLLGTEPFASECRNFWKRAEEVFAPALWHAEIISVLWMAVGNKVISPDESAVRGLPAASASIPFPSANYGGVLCCARLALDYRREC